MWWLCTWESELLLLLLSKKRKKTRSNRGIHLFSDNHCWLIWFLPYPHMLQVRRQKVPTNLRLHLFWRATQNLGNVSKQQPPRRRQNFEFMILNLFKSSISRPKSSKSLRSSSSKLPEWYSCKEVIKGMYFGWKCVLYFAWKSPKNVSLEFCQLKKCKRSFARIVI